MVVQNEKMVKEIRCDLKGGHGEISFRHMLSDSQMINCRLLTRMIIPPTASIGEHTHIGESEYYVVLSGSGIAMDNGVETNVTQGDLIKTGHHETHSIINNGIEPLEIIAIIITE